MTKTIRFTVPELTALLNAVTETTAGELDDDEWTDAAITALHTAESKLQTALFVEAEKKARAVASKR